MSIIDRSPAVGTGRLLKSLHAKPFVKTLIVEDVPVIAGKNCHFVVILKLDQANAANLIHFKYHIPTTLFYSFHKVTSLRCNCKVTQIHLSALICVIRNPDMLHLFNKPIYDHISKNDGKWCKNYQEKQAQVHVDDKHCVQN